MTGAGDLRHAVRFQESVQTADGSGGYTAVWQDIATHAADFAEIKVLSAAAQLAYGQLQTVVTHRLRVRFRQDVAPRMRVVTAEGVYDIVAVIDREGLRAWLEILARKTV